MYQQVYDPVVHSLGLTSLFAAIPLTLMFVMLGVFKRSPQLSALVSLAATVAVATLVYPMPFSAALNSGLYGVAFAILTIAWILVNAMWIYNMTVETGYFGVLRESFCRISDDLRIQAIIIAYCFGALIEALAGSGVPIAICSAMLVAIGFNPVKAAVVALVADTAPVAFGALAVPITTLNRMTDLPYNVLGAMVGRQCPISALVVPFVLVLIVDGVRGVRATWPVALAAGLAFALAQFVVSNFVAVPLSDIVASLVSAAAVVALTRVWSPKSIMRGVGDSPKIEPSMGATLLAYAPYIFIVVIFSLAQVPTIMRCFAHGILRRSNGQAWTSVRSTRPARFKNQHDSDSELSVRRGYAALHLRNFDDDCVQGRRGGGCSIVWRDARTGAVGLGHNLHDPGNRVRHELVRTNDDSWPFPVRASAPAYASCPPVIGWIGVVVTGSDNSTNALFGHLQVVAVGRKRISSSSCCVQHHRRGAGKMLFRRASQLRCCGWPHRPRRRDFPQRIRLGCGSPRDFMPVRLSSVDACAGLDGSVTPPKHGRTPGTADYRKLRSDREDSGRAWRSFRHRQVLRRGAGRLGGWFAPTAIAIATRRPPPAYERPAAGPRR